MSARFATTDKGGTLTNSIMNVAFGNCQPFPRTISAEMPTPVRQCVTDNVGAVIVMAALVACLWRSFL